MVAFIYRDEVYNPTEENRGLAELIVAKQRNGPTGTVKLQFSARYAKFHDLAHGPIDTSAQTEDSGFGSGYVGPDDNIF